MKVLHVVTLISPDGAYGGPVRVALNQAAALAGLGHDVVVAAGATGYDTLPTVVDGVPVRLFPAGTAVPGVGYAGTRAPAMGRWLADNASDFDIAHVHLARDLVTIPAARRLRRGGTPLVVQPHGMITPGSHPLAGPVDRLWTTRLLRNAGAVLYLNDRERDDLAAVGGARLALQQLDNGVPTRAADPTEPVDPGAVPEVMFMARLHPRKRPEVFAQAALELLRRGVRARFTIAGPTEGAEAAVDDVIVQARTEGFAEEVLRREPAVAPEAVAARMARTAVYVLPAAREPFGMTIVEALTQGTPVVICRDGGLAEFVTRHGCGSVVEGTPESFADAVAELLAAPERAREMGRRGRDAVIVELSIERVGRDLAAIYTSMAAGA